MNSTNGLFITVNDRPLNPMHITYYYVRDERKPDGEISYNIYYRMLEGRVISEEFTDDASRNAKLDDLASTEIKPKIIDDLNSTDPNAALSANQGRILKELCDSIPKFRIQVVDELPTEDISTSTIYLLRGRDSQGDMYQEYIYVDGEWELLGVQHGLLEDYYTKTEIDDKEATINSRIDSVEDRFFEGHDDDWNEKTEQEKENYLLAIVEGLAEISVSDTYNLNAITGSDEPIVVDMYEDEIVDATNEIIGGTE